MKKVLYVFATITIALISYFIGLQKSQQYSSADLAVIKAYILNDIKLTDSQIGRLDINKDGHITSMDYVLVKNKLSNN